MLFANWNFITLTCLYVLLVTTNLMFALLLEILSIANNRLINTLCVLRQDLTWMM
jgi:antibiotic biosynthesis monooxygenase (ABM) superfamily enzyme